MLSSFAVNTFVKILSQKWHKRSDKVERYGYWRSVKSKEAIERDEEYNNDACKLNHCVLFDALPGNIAASRPAEVRPS